MTETAIRLRKALDRANITPAELARRIETSDATISQQISGKHKISAKFAERMGDVLDVNPL